PHPPRPRRRPRQAGGGKEGGAAHPGGGGGNRDRLGTPSGHPECRLRRRQLTGRLLPCPQGCEEVVAQPVGLTDPVERKELLAGDRKSTRLNLQSREKLVCRLLLEKKKNETRSRI